jgi:hypothetical protein
MTVTPALPDRPYSQNPLSTEALPFRVRLAEGPGDLARALHLRGEAYGRHVPALAQRLQHAESDDLRPDALLLIAESHETRQLLGSVRLIHNLHGRLKVEDEAPLPARFLGKRLVEARRLTVRPGIEGRMVTPALIKAAYEICFHSRIDEALITARAPVDKMYRMMQFDDVLGGARLSLPDVGSLPHGLFSLGIREAEGRWIRARCPLYGFMALTHHPDIRIDYDIVHHRFSGLSRADLTASDRLRSTVAA